MAKDLADSSTVRLVQERLLRARGSVFDAFDATDCGFDHDAALTFLEGSPSFASLPRNRQGVVAGIVLGFAMVAIEADRDKGSVRR